MRVHHKTGVEMEALTGASVAALTIYDMCKALSHDIVIESRACSQNRRQARLSARNKEKDMNVPRIHGLVLAGGRSSRMHVTRPPSNFALARRNSTLR